MRGWCRVSGVACRALTSIQCSVGIETPDTRHATPSSLNTEYCILNTFYWFALSVQLLFYLLAALGLRSGSHTLFTSAPAMFLRLNMTTLLAWRDALQGRYRVDWQRA